MTLQPNMHLLSSVRSNALPRFAMQNDWKGQEDKRKRKLTLRNRVMSPDTSAKQFSTKGRVQQVGYFNWSFFPRRHGFYCLSYQAKYEIGLLRESLGTHRFQRALGK